MVHKRDDSKTEAPMGDGEPAGRTPTQIERLHRAGWPLDAVLDAWSMSMRRYHHGKSHQPTPTAPRGGRRTVAAERRRKVVELRGKRHTLAEIAAEMGITPQRVSQILQAALRERPSAAVEESPAERGAGHPVGGKDDDAVP